MNDTSVLPNRPYNQALKMYSGKMAWPLDPRPEDFDLNDIVRGICRENRFAGQTRLPVSVGWHSLCLSYVVPKHLRLAALVHDITEAYLKDLPRPVKNHPAFAFFTEIENNLFSVMADSLKLPFRVLPDDLKQIDSDIGTAEMSIFNPRGYFAVLESGFPLERHRSAQKIAKKVRKLIEDQVVPKPTREVAIRKAWIERFYSLHKVHV